MPGIDFEELLNRPAGSFKPPKLLPAGPYRMQTNGLEFGKSKEKDTPFAEVQLKVMEAMEGVDTEQLEGIELGKRTTKITFYFTEDATIRFTNFCKNALKIENCDQKSVKELCGEVKNGKFEFVGYVTHSPNKNAKGPDDPKFYANVDKFAAL